MVSASNSQYLQHRKVYNLFIKTDSDVVLVLDLCCMSTCIRLDSHLGQINFFSVPLPLTKLNTIIKCLNGKIFFKGLSKTHVLVPTPSVQIQMIVRGFSKGYWSISPV